MSNSPRYKQLHRDLKSEILIGSYKIGSLLPSESQLCKQYSLTRMTVRQALSELVSDGLISKKTGKGSIVVANRKSIGLLSFKGFTEVVDHSDSIESAQTINLAKPILTEWENPFFYPLTNEEISKGCIKFNRLRMIDQLPVMLEYTYFTNELSEFLENKLIDDSLFQTLHLKHQIEVIKVEQDISAAGADGLISSLLKIKEGLPILHIHRKYQTTKSGFYLYSSLYCNTEKYSIGNRF